ncbi:unnamed protein product, partial [Mesorhabditis belari]|uniref:Peptidase C1A papain C-terminal domain-containing protein n=1 Tax=Mesorhabditis belari TaxID=2138241 RepID=A0AAF3FAG1_9BILA
MWQLLDFRDGGEHPNQFTQSRRCNWCGLIKYSLSEHGVELTVSTIKRGCNGGYRPYAFKENGLVEEKAYPYTGKDGRNDCKLATNGNGWVLRSGSALMTTIFSRKTKTPSLIGLPPGPASFGMSVTKASLLLSIWNLPPTNRGVLGKYQWISAVTIIGLR